MSLPKSASAAVTKVGRDATYCPSTGAPMGDQEELVATQEEDDGWWGCSCIEEGSRGLPGEPREEEEE